MSGQPKTVLVVDDERPIRYVLSKQLEELGYRCVALSSGQEALARLGQQTFDIILLDLRMPGLSGLDVLRRMQTEHPRTPVIMLTALVDTGLAAQALRLGAYDYVTKPYNLEELRARVQRALDKKDSLAEGEGTDVSRRAEERGPIQEREVTKDLINQQMSVFEQLSQSAGPAKQKPKRGWWPWGRR
ncbi:MAG: response regulator [Chloroflexi bacterium]|nr:response regulator [Chloroflexota bacterium]